LHTNIRLGRKWLAETNTLAYISAFTNATVLIDILNLQKFITFVRFSVYYLNIPLWAHIILMPIY